MTSGHFTTFPIDQIYFDREKRQRKDVGDVKELAWSIQARGLIHPLVITRQGELIAGERRLTAVKSLGWDSVPVQFADELTDDEMKLIELDENIKRVNISWQEECEAVREFHNIHQRINPDWTVESTAKALNMSQSSTSEKLKVSDAIKENTELTAIPSMKTVVNIVRRKDERAAHSALKSLSPNTVERAQKSVPISNESFIDWTREYQGDAIYNFIHCDFPYGINADNQQQGHAVNLGSYSDSFGVYRDLLSTLQLAMSKVIANSAHIMFWFSMEHYDFTYKILTEMGWEINPFPLVWLKSDNTGLLPDPQRGPRRIYETAFFGSRGDRKIIRAVGNGISAPTTKVVHMSEKNLDMLSKFMSMFVDESTIGLDPTCGSGNALRAMIRNKATLVHGLEIDPGFVQAAKEHFYDGE